MGLFSKLINDVKKGDLNSLKNTVQQIADNAYDAVNNAVEGKPTQHTAQSAPQQAAPQQGGWQPPADPSGDSWGPRMPNEPNQFNFNGNYVQYFESVLREEFGAYAVHTDASEMDRRTVFTLTGAAGKALVIEVMTENSEARKIRRTCEKEGVPYLRFYFDHDGWWNTRSYVTRRIRAALR